MNRSNDRPAGYPDMDGGPAQDSERGPAGASSRRRNSTTRGPAGAPPGGGERPRLSFDPGSLLRPASKHWYWLLLGGLAGAIAGGALGLSLWRTGYSVSAQMVAYEPPVASDAYRPQKMSGQTIVGLMQSPEVFKRMGARMTPPVPGSALAYRIKPRPERGSDIVNVEAFGGDPASSIELANAYMREVVEFSQDNQRQDAAEADRYVQQHLKDVEADLVVARAELPAGAAASVALASLEAGAPPPAISGKRLEQLRAAEDELSDLLLKFTAAHPKVRAQRELLAVIKAGLPAGKTAEQAAATLRASTATASAATGTAGPLGAGGAGFTQELEGAYYKVRSLEALRRQLVDRQRAIQLFKANPPGNWRIVQPASPDNLGVQKPWMKIGLLAAFLGLLGFVGAGAEVLRREIFDNRLKTEADVLRVTGLPVLGSLGDIRQLSLSARESWAFRTWIALQDRLAFSPNHGLICGVTSSNSGDGRTTWINQLAGAARKCGFRVLTIATRATAEMPGVSDESTAAASEPVVVGAAVDGDVIHLGATAMPGVNGHARAARGTPAGGRGDGDGSSTAILTHPGDHAAASRPFSGESEFTALAASALFTPAMVTEKLMGPETDPLVHIPLPGWTWNLERRKQWQGALNIWRKIDNVVILVELPPASMPESVLLASNLPNLLWLVESGKSDATDTRNQLETLRHARCNLVGAVINRALTPATQGRFSRWFGCLALCTLLGAGLASPDALAADAEPSAAGTAFSVVSPAQRAQWQQKLTLGPGDLLNLGLYGEPQLDATDVPVGPDGRISYLEASGVLAAGLTVDEFRGKLNEALGQYRRAAQAIVVPVAYRSKKYFVLGKVAQRGAFLLDRPMTLLEAVGRAGGMETGLSSDRSLIELADLSRAFLSRGGRQLPVNFEKLFQEGDLTQNVTLEPNDYIYFPAADQQEVFVLGAVTLPGAYHYSQSTGALGAIAARGGFNTRAWKNKVLVIRGGLTKPETFTLDALEVLSARQADIRLQARDIVYVSERPWIRAEELLDLAAQAFVTAAVVTVTGERVQGIR